MVCCCTAASNCSDLWKYSNGNWTWIAGDTEPRHLPVYGIMGVSDALNVPPSIEWNSGASHLDTLFSFGGVPYPGT